MNEQRRLTQSLSRWLHRLVLWGAGLLIIQFALQVLRRWRVTEYQYEVMLGVSTLKSLALALVAIAIGVILFQARSVSSRWVIMAAAVLPVLLILHPLGYVGGCTFGMLSGHADGFYMALVAAWHLGLLVGVVGLAAVAHRMQLNVLGRAPKRVRNRRIMFAGLWLVMLVPWAAANVVYMQVSYAQFRMEVDTLNERGLDAFFAIQREWEYLEFLRQVESTAQLLVLIMGGLTIALVHRFDQRLKRLSANRCPICNYDLRAAPGRCSECGWAGDADGP